MKRERGFSMKENLDKYSEYTVFLRNIFKYSFIDIIHSNRNLSDQDRVSTSGGRYLRPQTDDVKDTGGRNLYFFFDITRLSFIFVIN